jgi:hypothetical protein
MGVLRGGSSAFAGGDRANAVQQASATYERFSIMLGALARRAARQRTILLMVCSHPRIVDTKLEHWK